MISRAKQWVLQRATERQEQVSAKGTTMNYLLEELLADERITDEATVLEMRAKADAKIAEIQAQKIAAEERDFKMSIERYATLMDRVEGVK